MPEPMDDEERWQRDMERKAAQDAAWIGHEMRNAGSKPYIKRRWSVNSRCILRNSKRSGPNTRRNSRMCYACRGFSS